MIPMQQMAGGETTLSREINPRDRHCFQRIISFGSRSWPPAGCLTAIFFLILRLSLFIYHRIYSCCNFLLPFLSRQKPTGFDTRTQVNEIYLTILGFREKSNFSLLEGGRRTFPVKERCDGLTSFHGRDKPPKPNGGGGMGDSDGSKRDKGEEKK